MRRIRDVPGLKGQRWGHAARGEALAGVRVCSWNPASKTPGCEPHIPNTILELVASPHCLPS